MAATLVFQDQHALADEAAKSDLFLFAHGTSAPAATVYRFPFSLGVPDSRLALLINIIRGPGMLKKKKLFKV